MHCTHNRDADDDHHHNRYNDDDDVNNDDDYHDEVSDAINFLLAMFYNPPLSVRYDKDTET